MPFLINRKCISVYQALFLRAGYQANLSIELLYKESMLLSPSPVVVGLSDSPIE